MFIRLIPAIGTKYSLAKGLGTQYRDVSENEGFHFMVLSVRGSRAVKPRRVSCSNKCVFTFPVVFPRFLGSTEQAEQGAQADLSMLSARVVHAGVLERAESAHTSKVEFLLKKVIVDSK